MDRKTLIAIGLCLVVFLLWTPLMKFVGLGQYVAVKRPPAVAVVDTTSSTAPLPRPIATAPDTAAGGWPTGPRSGSAIPVQSELRRAPLLPSAVIEQSQVLETPYYIATFSNRGARLVSIELKRFASHYATDEDRKHRDHEEDVPPGERVVLAGGPLLVMNLGSGETEMSLANVNYAVADSLGDPSQRRSLTFVAEDRGARIRQTYRVRPDHYAIDLEVEIQNLPAEWRLTDYSLTTRSWPLVTDDFHSDARAIRARSLVGTNLHNDPPGSALKAPKIHTGNVAWAAVQSRYFISAVAADHAPTRAAIAKGERRPLTAEEARLLAGTSKAPTQQDVAISTIVAGLPSSANPVHRYVLYAGPCQYSMLVAMKNELERAVDLGWTWIRPFSKALLWLLTKLYGLVRNYGVAIILLATLVRVLLHPLNMMSMRSMRAMQKLQPEMERLKQKYKSDPQAMNTAVMALYKDNKVNPAGGCLPMVLQMPLFFALYQVLFNAIELRQANFVGWINDLSAPDLIFTVGPLPIRLLPILMLGSGLLSQKLTPTNPTQLPSMYMMNVVMLVFFYNMPSGLVLYWTVMNLMNALQQWLILREHDPIEVAAPVVVGGNGKKRRTATR